MGVEAAPAVQVEAEARPWWESPLCLALVVLATMVPLLYPPIPPLVDLFGHMGRYRVELDLNHSSYLQQYYDYHWAAIARLAVFATVRAAKNRMPRAASRWPVRRSVPRRRRSASKATANRYGVRRMSA